MKKLKVFLHPLVALFQITKRLIEITIFDHNVIVSVNRLKREFYRIFINIFYLLEENVLLLTAQNNELS